MSVLLLTPMIEEVSIIARRAGVDERELDKVLESMSKKGLIFRVQRKYRKRYRRGEGLKRDTRFFLKGTEVSQRPQGG